jgi:[amino group carrier protein]-lysine/ornithine hydrolase
VTEGTGNLSFTKGLAQVPISERERKESRIAIAERILSTYSPSGEEGELATLIRLELERHGLRPRNDSAGNVICEIGSGSGSLLFCPHIDTVPGRLPVRREGSILYGRGATDAKGALISMLFAFEDIAEESGRDPSKNSLGRLIFAAVVEEERESKGLNQLIKDNVRADAAIFGEPCGVNRVTIGYRGHVPVSFEIVTKEAHSSAPWNATNAAEVAFSLYESLRKTLATPQSQSIDSVSVAITKIQSGSSHNVIPGHAQLSVDIRIPIGASAAKVAKTVREIASENEKSHNCSITANLASSTEPYRAKMDSKIVRAINRSIIKAGRKPSFISKSGTGDMNTYAQAFGVEAVTYGPGDTRLSHTESEFVDMEDVFACARVLTRTHAEFFALGI